jgi:hypothetical protein
MPDNTTKLGLADSRSNVTEAHVDDVHLVRGKMYSLTEDQVKRLRQAGVSLTDKIDEKEE